MNFIYKGVEYAPGTKVKIKTLRNGEQIMTYYSGVNTRAFVSDSPYVCSIRAWPPYVDHLNIIEIVEPVYPPEKQVPQNKRQCPPSWDVEIGWIWYILIMLVGLIFKDRWLIWIITTVVFFSWKSGLLNGGKK